MAMKENLKNKLNDFSLRNPFLRAVRIFIHQKVRPFFFRTIAVLLTLTVIVVITLQVFKPSYLSGVYRKISFRFQHYIHLDNQEFRQINIEGNKRTLGQDIINIVERVKSTSNINVIEDNYEPLLKKMTLEIKSELPWINNVIVTRSIPNTINVNVTEYEPFAIWQHKGKQYVTDKDGNTVLVDDLKEFEGLIIVSGDKANIHVNSLFNIFTIDPDLGLEVYSATWSGGRRWDIRLNSGLLIKLPERDISDAWDSLIKIYKMQGSVVGLKVMDLRIKGKVYLEYGDSAMKEIKNL